jgi:hypothetical protein
LVLDEPLERFTVGVRWPWLTIFCGTRVVDRQIVLETSAHNEECLYERDVVEAAAVLGWQVSFGDGLLDRRDRDFARINMRMLGMPTCVAGIKRIPGTNVAFVDRQPHAPETHRLASAEAKKMVLGERQEPEECTKTR